MTNLVGSVPFAYWTLDLRSKSVSLLDVDLTHPFLLANDLDLIT